MLRIKAKHLNYNPGVTGGPTSPLGITLYRGEGRDTGGRSSYWWHLEEGEYRGHDKLLAIYHVSECRLDVYLPQERWPFDRLRTHSPEEGLASLGFTVELY